jgi:hypothetical protein
MIDYSSATHLEDGYQAVRTAYEESLTFEPCLFPEYRSRSTVRHWHVLSPSIV